MLTTLSYGTYVGRHYSSLCMGLGAVLMLIFAVEKNYSEICHGAFQPFRRGELDAAFP